MQLEKILFYETQEFIIIPKVNNNEFVREKITVNRDAMTGIKLNHN